MTGTQPLDDKRVAMVNEHMKLGGVLVSGPVSA